MSKIFDTFDIDYDHVSFRYTASRVKEHVFVDKPDGIGVTQWLEFWESVRELYDDGRDLSSILDEAESDELHELRKANDELEGEVSDLESNVKNLEYEVADLTKENEDLRNELEELKFRFEGLDK